MKSKAHASVDEYMEALPSRMHEALTELREIIKKTVPGVEEVISYQIPTYRYHGVLVHFAAFARHASFFPGSKKLLGKFQDELSAFDVAGTTIRFQPERPIPPGLVRKILKARMKENETAMAAKQKSNGKRKDNS